MKQTYAKRAVLAAAAVLLALSVSGCRLNITGASDANGAIEDAAVPLDAGSLDSPQKAYHTKDNGAVVPVPGQSENDAMPDATTESTTGKSAKTPPAKPEAAWNADQPKLLGIALGDAKTATAAKLGKPVDSYSMADGDDKLDVEEYASFSVGYGSDRKVVFVEVFDKAAATGLSGLRIGVKADAAIKALGKPGTHTSSVLAYEADGALLKLDLDPQNDRVVSIKLFSPDRQP